MEQSNNRFCIYVFLYFCIFVFLYLCIFVLVYFCIHFLEELSRRNVPLSMEQPRKPNFLVLLMWSHLSCQHYSNFSAENKLATQRKEFCWTRGFGRHESLEVIHKQAHNALQWSIYRIGSSPLYQMKKQMHSGLVVAFLAISCVVLFSRDLELMKIKHFGVCY